MKLRFTNHAKYRVLERKIKTDDVKLVLKNPDFCGYTFDNKMVARKLIDGKTLEVVYTKIKSETLIITIYYL